MGDERSFLSMYCRNCQAPRYRSLQPMGRKDQVKPEMFRALEPESPPPAEGPATCYLCHHGLVIIPDNKLPPLEKSQPVRNTPESSKPTETFQGYSDPISAPAPVASTSISAASGAEILFELTGDEEMRGFNDLPDAYLIVTNKRVVRVRKN